MSNGSSPSLSELDARIAVLRDNIRKLIEQAAGFSGAEDEERNADRIAQQTEELEAGPRPSNATRRRRNDASRHEETVHAHAAGDRTMSRPPFPPFTAETAAQKVRMAEDGWNSRDPARVALAYASDSRWLDSR